MGNKQSKKKVDQGDLQVQQLANEVAQLQDAQQQVSQLQQQSLAALEADRLRLQQQTSLLENDEPQAIGDDVGDLENLDAELEAELMEELQAELDALEREVLDQTVGECLEQETLVELPDLQQAVAVDEATDGDTDLQGPGSLQVADVADLSGNAADEDADGQSDESKATPVTVAVAAM